MWHRCVSVQHQSLPTSACHIHCQKPCPVKLLCQRTCFFRKRGIFLASSHTHSFLIQLYVHMCICCGTGVFFFFCFILQLRRKRSNACRRCSSFVVPRPPVYSFARLFTQPLIVVLAGWLVDRGIEMEIITCSLIQLVTALISCFVVCLCACVCVCLCGCALVRHMCCHSPLVNI